MKLSAELETNLRELALTGPVELHENGTRVAPLSTLSWEVRGQAKSRCCISGLRSDQSNIGRYGYFPGSALSCLRSLKSFASPSRKTGAADFG